MEWEDIWVGDFRCSGSDVGLFYEIVIMDGKRGQGLVKGAFAGARLEAT